MVNVVSYLISEDNLGANQEMVLRWKRLFLKFSRKINERKRKHIYDRLVDES